MFLFHDLAQLADTLAIEPSRLKKRAAIAQSILALVAPTNDTIAEHALESAGLFCLYLAGQPFPEADPRKLNTGGALLTKALKQVSGCTDAALTAAYRRHGDLGAAAFDLLKPPTEPTLTLDELSNAFDTLATARTTAARSATLVDLLRRATPLEAKYVLKLMLGDMRIGVKQSLIEEAIAAASGTEAAAVRHAVMLEANLARAVTLAFTNTLTDARMTLFHPLGFMLASPVDTPEEAIARFTEKPLKALKKQTPSTESNPETTNPEPTSLNPTPNLVILSEAQRSRRTPVLEGAQPTSTSQDTQEEPAPIRAYLEDKYDGMRAQLHCGDPTQPTRVVLYSRNREDITASFPELSEAFAHVTEPLILDGEILGWDLALNKALPFTILSQRIGRKRVDDSIRQQIPAIFMAFDILFQGDQLLLNHPLRDRRHRLEILTKTLAPQTLSPLQTPDPAAQPSLFATPAEVSLIPRLMLSPATLVTSAEAIDQAYTDARARSNEGVMLKAANSHYLPGRRGLSWVKLKRELATLDVVITGAEYGHGKRAGLLSDYTFAVRSPDGELLNVGKAYSGVTDAEILELTAWLKAHTLEDHGHFRTVEPLRILEVAFNNIMRSTRHASGFALRFPRIIRIRDDKPVTEIDTLERVEEIYQSQPDRPVE
jgi:DNA ligase-1